MTHELLSRRRASVRARLFLISLGLILGLGLGEAAARTYHWWFGAAHLAGSPAYEKGAHSATDHEARPLLAVIGASTAEGYPYRELQTKLQFSRQFTLLSVPELLLKKRLGYPKTATEYYAVGGWPLEAGVRDFWKSSSHKPDVIVLYSGDNEFSAYYSVNMKPPPDFLLPIEHLEVGRLVLQWLFNRQAEETDRVYQGNLFSENRIPEYERRRNLERFRRYLELLAGHCRRAGITLIVVIPDGNYMYPPARSIYHGPESRSGEALKLFKKAIYLKYFCNETKKSLAVLESIAQFCEFADLDFELGDIYYRQHDYAPANRWLRKAIDADGLSDRITSPYKAVLRDVAGRFDLPTIDMNRIATVNMRVPVPDFSCHVDVVHLRPRTYEALAQEMIRVMARRNVCGLKQVDGDLDVTAGEWANDLGLSNEVIGVSSLVTFVSDANELAEKSFLRFRAYRMALEQLDRMRGMVPDSVIDNQSNHFREKLKQAESRALEWINEGVEPKDDPCRARPESKTQP